MKKILMFGGIGLVVLIIIGVVVYMMFIREPAEKPIVYTEVALGEMYNNIAASEGQTKIPIIKFNPVVQVTNEEAQLKINEMKTAIITDFKKYFITRTSEQLVRIDRVQEDLTEIVIEVTGLDIDSVSNVFFLEFIIQ